MSLEVRQSLQRSLIFQYPATQRHQLTEAVGAEYILNTDLIDVMLNMCNRGMLYVITSLRTDHSFDGGLGPDSHSAGKAMDFWFLDSHDATDYMDPRSLAFRSWLWELTKLPYVTGVGLGGTANSDDNRSTLGGLGFVDDGQDHIHIQVS